MKNLIVMGLVGALLATTAHAQPKKLEKNVEKQRKAVAAWTACIADENEDEVQELLRLDFKSKDYASRLNTLSNKRVSSECFQAMPRSYRRIELSGLPFVGGLAERVIASNEASVLNRLSMAAVGKAAPTFSHTDKVANCTVRGAPHIVAGLFATEVSSDDEQAAIAQINPVIEICSANGPPIEASPLALRSMLATAAFRLLDAQKDESDA